MMDGKKAVGAAQTPFKPWTGGWQCGWRLDESCTVSHVCNIVVAFGILGLQAVSALSTK